MIRFCPPHPLEQPGPDLRPFGVEGDGHARVVALLLVEPGTARKPKKFLKIMVSLNRHRDHVQKQDITS